MEDTLLSEALIEETFLWCVRRLGNSHDAEDLSQEILTTALSAQRRGQRIDNFYAWYWAMAKNRLRIFLRMQKTGAAQLDTETLSLAAEDDTAAALLREEEISALNYALSRLSALHRQTVILYYLREMKIADIARTLGIPEGTVKRRLFDAKNDIRKGMNDMTTVGKSAYAPAEVNLWGSGGIPNYWNDISDLMTTQIFAVCARESHTVREIADEIGVAPVYFEAKLRWLLERKFMKEYAPGRYLTDFVLYPAQAYADFGAEVAEVYANIGQEITDAICRVEDKLRALPFYGNSFPRGQLLWTWYVFAAEALQSEMSAVYSGKWMDKIPKDNGKTYRLAGTVRAPEETVVNRAGTRPVPWSNLHNNFRTSGYRHIEHANLFQAEPFGDRDSIISDKNADLFMRLFEDPALTLTPNEEEEAGYLIRAGYLVRRDGKLYPTMPLLPYEIRQKMLEILRGAVAPAALRYTAGIGALAEKILLPLTRSDLLEEFVHWIVSGSFFPVGYLLRYGMETPGVLELPSDYSASSFGICIYYRK
ncbi:MAG: RNA polymerase sigma factor [Eubacteriales bacterium]